MDSSTEKFYKIKHPTIKFVRGHGLQLLLHEKGHSKLSKLYFTGNQTAFGKKELRGFAKQLERQGKFCVPNQASIPSYSAKKEFRNA